MVIFIHHVYFGLSGEKFKLYPFVQKCTFIICWTLNTPIWIVYLGGNIDKRTLFVYFNVSIIDGIICTGFVLTRNETL